MARSGAPRRWALVTNPARRLCALYGVGSIPARPGPPRPAPGHSPTPGAAAGPGPAAASVAEACLNCGKDRSRSWTEDRSAAPISLVVISTANTSSASSTTATTVWNLAGEVLRRLDVGGGHDFPHARPTDS